ncbi:unnamed protein product [Parascedosporium putredinis]|uniref:N-acetyltransferase domain-containing protein n=1 Tax=Parascedosporium putredinis TaxID=1442378 RepID=A0A9P1GWN5_9PEZI|nr:unnamed protein product [Parascedosporium putredinis]CAI7988349.1 unnamed protein product [Parascedosporium putredinis]
MASFRSQLRDRTWTKAEYFISTNPSLVPIPALIEAFDSDDFYWAKALPAPAMVEMLHNSLCFGLYQSPLQPTDAESTKLGDDKKLIGFARLVTDFTTFSYLTDVWVHREYQGQGLGSWLVTCIQEVVQTMPHLRRNVLFTADWDRSVPFYEKWMNMKVVESKFGSAFYSQGHRFTCVAMKRLRNLVSKSKGRSSEKSAPEVAPPVDTPRGGKDGPTVTTAETPPVEAETSDIVKGKLKELWQEGVSRGKVELVKGKLKVEKSIDEALGLGSKPNVVPAAEPDIYGGHRKVEIGWHPQDEKLDVIYINGKVNREEWHTFEVGRTRFNDEALRQAGEMVIFNMRQKKAAYNLISNNCQNFAVAMLDAIQVGAHMQFATSFAVYQTATGLGSIKGLFSEKPPEEEEEGGPGDQPSQSHQNAVQHAQHVMDQHTTQLDSHTSR